MEYKCDVKSKSGRNEKVEYHISEGKTHKPEPSGFGLKCDINITYVVAHGLV